MKKVEFREAQRFRGWDIIILLGFFSLGLLYRAIAGLAGWWGAPSSDRVPVYLFFGAVTFAALLYYLSIRLFIVVNDKGVKFQFYPLHAKKRKIPWEEVESCRVIRVPPQAALTGWAVHFSEEKRFSVTGRRSGLALDLKSGEHLFIGTQHPEDLQKVVKKIRGKKD